MNAFAHLHALYDARVSLSSLLPQITGTTCKPTRINLQKSVDTGIWRVYSDVCKGKGVFECSLGDALYLFRYRAIEWNND